MQHSPKRHPLRRSALYLLRTLSENSSLLPSRLILPENLDPTPLVPLKPSGNSVVFQGSYDSKKIAAKQIFSYSYDKKVICFVALIVLRRLLTSTCSIFTGNA
jgi:hypothetical protein